MISLRPLARPDLLVLGRWLAAPHVREWWREDGLTPADVERDYGPQIDGADTACTFVIEADAAPVGIIQCYRHADTPDWDRAIAVPSAAGLDYLIGMPEFCGRGVGTAAVAGVRPLVFALYPDVKTVVSVPQQDNLASRRVLEKAGFTLVGERLLKTGDASDAGISAIYSYDRP